MSPTVIWLPINEVFVRVIVHTCYIISMVTLLHGYPAWLQALRSYCNKLTFTFQFKCHFWKAMRGLMEKMVETNGKR